MSKQLLRRHENMRELDFKATSDTDNNPEKHKPIKST